MVLSCTASIDNHVRSPMHRPMHSREGPLESETVFLATVYSLETFQHLIGCRQYQFMVMSRIFKAARPWFNVISGIEDYINGISNLKKLSLSIALALE